MTVDDAATRTDDPVSPSARPDVDAVQLSPRSRAIEYAVLFAIGAAGLAIKRPFGEFLFKVMGKPLPSGPHTFWEWLARDTASMIVIAVGCLLHSRSGLPAAPWIEKVAFHVRTKTRAWRAGILGALACILIFAVSQFAQKLWGHPMPLTQQLNTGAISKADQIKLAELYPLAFIGAALSEEVVFRFGWMSLLAGAMSFIRRPTAPIYKSAIFWIANAVQAAWFGYVHVNQGIVVGSAGGLFTSILAAPQTWSGVVFGYVYGRRGIEAAIVAHMATDILVPIFLLLCGRFLH